MTLSYILAGALLAMALITDWWQDRYGPMTVECAWCKAIMTPGGKRISHGICPECDRKMRDELMGER